VAAGEVEDVTLALPPPALIKPRPLWTGKQLLSALVRYFTRSQPPLNLTSGSKVPADYWGRTNDEGQFVMHQGELVTGCLDKAQFGKFGLVHAVQELYGNTVAGELLSALSRMGTLYLQWHGFTCGMNDLLLVAAAEQARVDVLGRAECSALKASAEVGQQLC
jgi:DNA-directed RNA polymerase I subunit RPA1